MRLFVRSLVIAPTNHMAAIATHGGVVHEASIMLFIESVSGCESGIQVNRVYIRN